MSSLSNNGLSSHANRRESSATGEDTLRLIANLPAPAGLANRIKAGLTSAPDEASPRAIRSAAFSGSPLMKKSA